MNDITIQELEAHLTHWFGESWDNQSGAQIYAMVVDLLNRVNVPITDTEGFRTVEQMIKSGEVINATHIPKY